MYMYRVFRSNLSSLIPVIGQLVKLTCKIISMPKKLKGVEICYFQNFILTQTSRLFWKFVEKKLMTIKIRYLF